MKLLPIFISGRVAWAHMLIFHIAIHMLGVSGFAAFLSKKIEGIIPFKTWMVGAFEWSTKYTPVYTKFYSLATFVTGVAVIWLLFVACLILWVRRENIDKTANSISVSCFLVWAGLIISINIITVVLCGRSQFITLIWLGSLFGPFWLVLLQYSRNSAWLSVNRVILYGFIVFLVVFVPLIFGRVQILNDYMGIPEQTILKDGRIVDNNKFINEHQLLGLNKYDPRYDAGRNPSPNSEYSVQIEENAFIDEFVRNMEEGGNEFKYYIDQYRHLLVVRGAMTFEEKIKLMQTAVTENNKKAVNDLYVKSRKANNFAVTRLFTDEEKDFLKKNKHEIYNQGLLGWFFYHHNYYYGPINAIANGASISETPILYGVGNTLGVATLLKWIGRVDFQTYFKLTYLLYPIYLLFLAGFSWLIFRRMDYAAIVALGGLGSVLLLNHEVLRLAPGFNPIRHIFDLPTLYLLFLSRREDKRIYLLGAFALALFAIWWSKEFGLFLFLALLATVVSNAVFNRKLTWQFLAGILTVSTVGLLLTTVSSGAKSLIGRYLLVGVALPVTPAHIVIASMFLTILMYSLLALVYRFCEQEKKLSPLTILGLFLTFYIQFTSIYWIWYPMHHHLSTTILFLVLFFTVLLKLLLGKFFTFEFESGTIKYLVTTMFFICVLPLFILYQYQGYRINRVIDEHVNYIWSFEKAQFITTMNPAPFEDAVRMIQQFSLSPKVIMISKYDHIIPALAGKYLSLPFIGLADSLVSQREVDIAAQAIISSKEEFLYVDTDIERNLNGEIINDYKGQGLSETSLGRVMALSVMKKVFEKVKGQFRPVKQGMLITVYKRLPLQ